jgi:dipeptidyl aminopeptidase/acylaminoacyl peptidase
MLRFPDVFHAGVASSGSHEMRAYMAGAGLSDMGPSIAAYDAMTNAALAGALRGRLLLITSDMDENCHPLHTMRVVDALIAANRDFELLVMPNRNHACTLDPYFVRRR